MRSAKFLTADLVYIYRPNLHVTDRRIAITERLIGILPHDNIQGFHLLVEILLVSDLSPSDHALRTHTVATSYLRVLENQGMVNTKRNTDFRLRSNIEMLRPSCAECK